jgi:integral membrane protein
MVEADPHGDEPIDASPLLARFRTIAWTEGLSYVALLFIAMPLKYFADMPLAVRVVGMAHGLLFIAYVVLVALLWARGTFSLLRATWALLMSVVPFGTFLLDRQIARDLGAVPPSAE